LALIFENKKSILDITIKPITAQEILTAHPNPAVEVEVLLANGSWEQAASVVQLIQPISFP
jgi:hypothetical protein